MQHLKMPQIQEFGSSELKYITSQRAHIVLWYAAICDCPKISGIKYLRWLSRPRPQIFSPLCIFPLCQDVVLFNKLSFRRVCLKTKPGTKWDALELETLRYLPKQDLCKLQVQSIQNIVKTKWSKNFWKKELSKIAKTFISKIAKPFLKNFQRVQSVMN